MTAHPGPQATRTYRAAPGLRVRSWGEGSDIVYLPSTRNTHLVDATSGALLQALAAQGPADPLTLWTRLAADTEAEPEEAASAPTEEELQSLLGCLHKLAEFGFVA